MQVYHFPDGPGIGSYLMLMTDLLDAPIIHTGEWQAMNTTGSPAHRTHEIEDVSLVWDQVPNDLDKIVPAIDLNWANEHFLERVSGHPYNPAPSHIRWPYAVRANADHTAVTHRHGQHDWHTHDREDYISHQLPIDNEEVKSERFDHTYPERFWPKHAGHDHDALGPRWREAIDATCGGTPGVRFHYGDLDDVVTLLLRHPLTRQAYLPVWFPEDTGANDGQRVPCTIGYHFMQRRGFLSCRYYIRSVDAYRHLSNDVYFTARLMSWVCAEMARRTEDSVMKLKVRPGALAMHIASLHSFVGDKQKMVHRINQIEVWS